MHRLYGVALALTLATPALAAETAFELAFRTGTLDSFDAGASLTYDSDVSLPTEGESGGGEATVAVALDADGAAVLRMRKDDSERVLGTFDAEVGNPIGMYFLERTIRTISEETGGSAFYIRNRIKDALREPEAVRPVDVEWLGETVQGSEIRLAPFDGDPNLAQLGSYGDLVMRLVVGEEVPGWYHTLEAESGGGAYSSTLTLEEAGR